MGDRHDKDMCWFYKEMHLQDRGKYPRKKDSVNEHYVAIVEHSWKRHEGDDYDGFPFKEDFSDEELEQFEEEAFGSKHVD